MSFKPLIAAALALLVSACVDEPSQGHNSSQTRPVAQAAAKPCVVPADVSANAAEMVNRVNAERGKAGLRAVALSGPAIKVAQAFACETSVRRDISHRGNDGSNAGSRLMRTGIRLRVVAENTATGYITADKAIAAWMASSGHRNNILTPEVTLAGVGQAMGAYPTWVLILYAPR